jgi:hypothetical protein
MGSGVDIPWVGWSIYHGGQNTMGRGIDIPWLRGRYIMGRGFAISSEWGSIYNG